MWYLISTLKSDEKHVFLCDKEYIFGRKDCDIVLTGDPAVSRRHASIQVTNSQRNLAYPDKLPIIQLKDLSKFGTWVSGKRVDGEVMIKDGDRMFFGSPKSSFKIVYEPFIVITSCLDTPSKTLCRTIVSNVGGHLVKDWHKDCNILVMDSISVTIKVICALVSQKFIVTSKYLVDYQKYLSSNGEKPDPENYLPSVIESNINPEDVSFLPDVRRQTVFQSLKFIFLNSKQFEKMNMIIEAGGGICILMEEETDDTSILYETGSIVMTLTDNINTLSNSTEQWYQQVSKILKKKKKSMIADSEIGYAVLYCSTVKHCNPDILVSSQVIPDIKSQSLSTQMSFETSDVLAVNTEIAQQGKKKEKKISSVGGIKSIDETFISKKSAKRNSPTPTRKRTEAVTATISTPVEIKEIKDEPFSPEKPQTNKNTTVSQTTDLKPESMSTCKRNRSPSSVTEMTSAQKRRRSPSPLPEMTSARILRRSPSPVPEITSARKRRRSPSPVPEMTSQKRRQSPSPVPEIMSASKRKRLPSPATAESDIEKSNVFQNIKTSPDDSRTFKRTSSPSRAENMSAHLTDSKHNKVTECKTKVKSEEVSIIEDEYQMEENNSTAEIRLQDGFLTTRQPMKNQTIKCEGYVYESDLPERLVVTSFTHLVTRQPKTKDATRGEAAPEGFVKWKGKLVKNYKKFNKVRHAGSDILPTIIGGSDLQVHEAEKSKELENWFQLSVQAESQVNEEEREAQELFDYKPYQSRKKTR